MSSRYAFCVLVATVITTHALQASQEIAKDKWWPAMFSRQDPAGADDKVADLDSPDEAEDKAALKKKHQHKAAKKVVHKAEHKAAGKAKGQYKETDKAIQNLRKAIEKFEKAEDKEEEKTANEASNISKQQAQDKDDYEDETEDRMEAVVKAEGKLAKEEKQQASGNGTEKGKANLHATSGAVQEDTDFVLNDNLFGANRTKPRMLVTQGCDASNSILTHAHFLLGLHGIVTPAKLAISDNRTTTNTTAATSASSSMNQLMESYASHNQSVVFKGVMGKDKVIFSNALVDMGTLVAQNSRKNVLDVVSCMIRDCADPALGFPMKEGKRSDICRKRRAMEKKDLRGYKAYVNTSTLYASLVQLQEQADNSTKDLAGFGYNVRAVYAEELLDFEWSSAAVGKGLRAWSQFLKAWGIKPMENEITEYLTANSGKRDPPMATADVIFNIDEVNDVLKQHDRFRWMVRD